MRAEVSVPASKSLTNRYLLLAALAEGTSTVINPLESRDSQLMLAALRALGARTEHIADWEGTGEAAYRITPIPLDGAPAAGRPAIDCGLAGTVMRFLPAVAALTGRTVDFDGDPEARIRPMGAVLEGLRALGVTVDRTGAGTPVETLPFTVSSPSGLAGGEISIDASASSQFVSGLLLAAPRMRRGLTLRHVGSAVPSSEHVEMTLHVLRELGVSAHTPEPFVWRVDAGAIEPFTVRVEPDLSNAGPFLSAALVTGGTVVMRGWPRESTQIGRRWPELLQRFGASVTTAPETGGRSDTLTVSGSIDAEGIPLVTGPGEVHGTAELTPTVAALAALAPAPTRFSGIAHLRGHETDRIAALVTELRRLGARAEETADGFTVQGPVTEPATVRSYADHRMATFGAVVGLALRGVQVEDIGCTSKTMPAFPRLWQAMVDGTADRL